MRIPTPRGQVFTKVQYNKLADQLKQATQEQDQLKLVLSQRDQQVTAFQNEAKAAKRERDNAKSKLASEKSKLTQSNKAVNTLQGQLRTTQADLAGKNQTIAGLRNEVKDLKRGASATSALAGEKAQLASEVVTLQGQIANLEAANATYLGQIQKLASTPQTPVIEAAEKVIPPPVVLTVSDAMSNIGSQVASAQAKMKSTHNFAIDNVNVTIRGKTDDAGQIKMYDAALGDKAAALDEITFGILAKDDTADISVDQVAVPNLRGLTLGAATRALSTIGLRIDSASGTAPRNAGLASGQAFRQSPAPEEAVDRGTSVLVVFNQ